MKKFILISTISAIALFADTMTDMAKDAAISKAKSEAKTAVIQQVAGDDAVKKEVATKVADKVLGTEDPVDKMKSDAVSAVVGSTASVSDASSLLAGATKETSLQDKALDMAAEQVVGSDTIKKEVAKSVVKEALK